MVDQGQIKTNNVRGCQFSLGSFSDLIKTFLWQRRRSDEIRKQYTQQTERRKS